MQHQFANLTPRKFTVPTLQLYRRPTPEKCRKCPTTAKQTLVTKLPANSEMNNIYMP